MLAQDDYKFKYISHVFRVKSKGLPQFAIFHMSLDGQPISWGQLLDSPRQATYIFHSRSIDARDCSCRESYPYNLAEMLRLQISQPETLHAQFPRDASCGNDKLEFKA